IPQPYQPVFDFLIGKSLHLDSISWSVEEGVDTYAGEIWLC
ncbi:MAG: hypothetical protein UX81_C0012G0001, partial [Parcubacteria group bacterium GW2011_GWA2_47_12]